MSSDEPYWRLPTPRSVWSFSWRLMVSKPVSGSCHVCFRVGDHSKELFHYTSTAEALENLPRIALQKPREEWPSWSPHIALVMGSSLTKLAFPGSPDPSFRSLQLRRCGFALASSPGKSRMES